MLETIMTPVQIARDNVLEKSRIWLQEWRKVASHSTACFDAETELLGAIALMVSREESAIDSPSALSLREHPFEVGQ